MCTAGPGDRASWALTGVCPCKHCAGSLSLLTVDPQDLSGTPFLLPSPEFRGQGRISSECIGPISP